MSTSFLENGTWPPEAELVVLAVGPHQGPEEKRRIGELVHRGLDWDRLSSYAGWHRVLPVLHDTLARLQPEGVPHDARARIAANAGATLRNNLLIAGELARLARLFAGRGIAMVPFKGPVLALRLYGGLALRPFTDLDLLVRPGDIPAAQELLAAAGYHPLVPLHGAQERAYFRYEHDRTFVASREGGGHVTLELHWRFFARYVAFPFDLNRFRDHLDRVPLGGADIPSLPAEELLLLLALHGAKHRWSALGWILDVARLPEAFPRFDWERAVRLARESGTERVLHLALRLADALWGLPMPETVRAAVASDGVAGRLAGDVLSRLARPDEPRVMPAEESRFYLATRERFGDRLRYYILWTLTPNFRDRTFLPLPGPLTPLYYLARPLRILADVLRRKR